MPLDVGAGLRPVEVRQYAVAGRCADGSPRTPEALNTSFMKEVQNSTQKNDISVVFLI
jgi:hypothetical protein